MYPNAANDADNRRIGEEREKRKFNVRTFDSFPVRRWDRWVDDRQLHVFVQDLSPGAAAADLLAGTRLAQDGGFGARALDSGEQLDAVWTPDGASIVFAATTARDAGAYTTVLTDLFEVPARGGEPRQLTTRRASYSQPRFSPDGKSLFYVVADEDEQIYAHDRLGSAPWPWNGETRTITATFDRSVATWTVAGDGRSVYLTAEDEGLEKVYSVPSGGGPAQLVVSPERGVYTNLTGSSSSLVANWGSSIEPSEIVRIDPHTKRHVALTKFATAKAAAIDWQPLQHFWFTSSRGRRIHNMIALPSGFDPSRKYPLFVVIHGGAANMWRDQITLRWNYHLLAQPGYVVLLTNYTGSTGFGEEFARDIHVDPFEGPASEINEAADEAIRRYRFIDGSRQVAAGASYGGHLANWLEATTTRYKALISHAGLVNPEAQWGTSDGIYHRELMAGGPPWEQTPTWRNQNPIRRAAKFKTPMLLSVGEKDYRVPLNNTLEMWSALQRMRVPARLLVWPDENHWILNGENSRVFYQEVHAWIAKWLTPADSDAPATRPATTNDVGSAEYRRQRGEQNDRRCELDPELRALADEQQAEDGERGGEAEEVPVELLGLLGDAERGREALAGVDDRVGDVAVAVAIELEILAAGRGRDRLQRFAVEPGAQRDVGILHLLAARTQELRHRSAAERADADGVDRNPARLRLENRLLDLAAPRLPVGDHDEHLGVERLAVQFLVALEQPDPPVDAALHVGVPGAPRPAGGRARLSRGDRGRRRTCSGLS